MATYQDDSTGGERIANRTKPTNPRQADLSQALAKRLGPKGWLTDDIGRYQSDWLNRVSPPALGAARPDSTEDIAAVIQLAAKAGVSITPQGGNTGLCAGSIPGKPGAIILSLSRLNKVLSIDPVEFTVKVEAGAILANLDDELAKHGLMVPLRLGSEGSAQIGGLIATNAGGSHALRYGTMQDLVLGLEVVLSDGNIWDGTRSLLKDNSGYQLRRLFCGSEGTLGVVTQAVLRTCPRPQQQSTALLALSDFHKAVRFGTELRRRLCEFLSALEFFSDTGLVLALRHVEGLAFPLETRAPVYVLVELSTSSAEVPLSSMLESELGEALEGDLVLDGAVATTEAQHKSLWRLREEVPEGQRLEGPQIKHDIAVPVASLASFIDEVSLALCKRVPGLQVNAFGHLGDGNIHFNLTPPEGDGAFFEQAAELSRHIYGRAVEAGGTFSAEHGLGRTKVDYADALRDPVERGLMRRVKQALDPNDLMNPGVIMREGKE